MGFEEALACAGGGGFRLGSGEVGLGEGEGVELVLKLVECGVAALALFDPKEGHELGYALVEPGMRGGEPGVR